MVLQPLTAKRWNFCCAANSRLNTYWALADRSANERNWFTHESIMSENQGGCFYLCQHNAKAEMKIYFKSCRNATCVVAAGKWFVICCIRNVRACLGGGSIQTCQQASRYSLLSFTASRFLELSFRTASCAVYSQKAFPGALSLHYTATLWAI